MTGAHSPGAGTTGLAAGGGARGGTGDRHRPLAAPPYLLRFFDTLYPGSVFGPRFTICAGFRLRGRIDVGVLRASVEDVVRRHEALRTIVVEGDGVPWQRVAGDCLPPDVIVRSREVPPAERDAAIDDLLTELDVFEHPSDDLPLLTAFVEQYGDDDGVLALVTHHTASDATSNQILMRDIAAFYDHRSTGRPLELAELLQYGDHALALQQADEHARRERALAYWEEVLTGVAPAALPTDHERPPSGSGRQGLLRFDVEATTTARVAELARAARATPFMVLLAAYVLLHHRLTGAIDVAVPTLTSGRAQRSVANTVGFFVNTQLLRIPLDGDPALGEVLERVRAACMAALTHEVPILQVMERAPDVALLLADERFVLMPFQLIPLATEPRPLGPNASYLPIARRPRTARGMALPMDGLWTMRLQHTLLGNVAFSRDLFDEESVRTMCEVYLAGLERMLDEPDARLSKIAP